MVEQSTHELPFGAEISYERRQQHRFDSLLDQAMRLRQSLAEASVSLNTR